MLFTTESNIRFVQHHPLCRTMPSFFFFRWCLSRYHAADLPMPLLLRRAHYEVVVSAAALRAEPPADALPFILKEASVDECSKGPQAVISPLILVVVTSKHRLQH
jgi:hypothetical protein